MRVRNGEEKELAARAKQGEQTGKGKCPRGAEKIARGGPPPGVTQRPKGKMAAAIVSRDSRTHTASRPVDGTRVRRKREARGADVGQR